MLLLYSKGTIRSDSWYGTVVRSRDSLLSTLAVIDYNISLSIRNIVVLLKI